MKKLVILNLVLTLALMVYVLIFVPPVGKAPIEPTPTLSNEGRWLAPGIWAGPAPTDTPGPSPIPKPTQPLLILPVPTPL